MLQEEADLAALQDREKAVRQLESDIVDVNTIFKVTELFTLISSVVHPHHFESETADPHREKNGAGSSSW